MTILVHASFVAHLIAGFIIAVFTVLACIVTVWIDRRKK